MPLTKVENPVAIIHELNDMSLSALQHRMGITDADLAMLKFEDVSDLPMEQVLTKPVLELIKGGKKE